MTPPVRAPCECCGRISRALKSIDSEIVTYRCDECGENSWSEMPVLDKKVVYLDQFAISEIFKVRSSAMRAAAPHRAFWTEVSELIEKAVLLQQLICPPSDIHRDESMVFARGDELALAHEMLSGDVSFKSSREIESDQLLSYLDAIENEVQPTVDLSVDGILQGRRNEWLPRLHISAKMDWSVIAETVRDLRDQSPGQLAPLYKRWREDLSTSFKSVLKTELESFGTSRIEAYQYFVDIARRGLETNDPAAFMNGALSGPVQEFRMLRDHFHGDGSDLAQAEQRVLNFWMWPGNRSMPHHRIQAYLFAAVARKILSGQKKDPTRGVLNDIRAIGTYAPYVDAMLVDSEFAALLRERPLCDDLEYRAAIYSLRSKDEFLDYLRRLVEAVPVEVEMIACALYGEGARRSTTPRA